MAASVMRGTLHTPGVKPTSHPVPVPRLIVRAVFVDRRRPGRVVQRRPLEIDAGRFRVPQPSGHGCGILGVYRLLRCGFHFCVILWHVDAVGAPTPPKAKGPPPVGVMALCDFLCPVRWLHHPVNAGTRMPTLIRRRLMSRASAERTPGRGNVGRCAATIRNMTFIGKQKAHQKSNGQTTYRAVTGMTVVTAPASSNSSRNIDRWQTDSSSQ